jgi:uncharacterized protein (TIGR03437 family)
MKKVFGAIAIMALLCFRAHGATLITTITIKGTGASAAGSVTASGTVGFVGDLAGSGAFSSSFTLLDPNTLSGKIPVNLTVTTGNIIGTLTGTLTASPLLLSQVLAASSTANGPGSLAITSGTAGFAGVTGSFTVNVAGNGAGTTGSGSGSFTISGPGTLNLPVTTGAPPATIGSVLNNYGLVPPGFPNYGIAPGTLFIIKGSGMADPAAQAVLQSTAGPGIPFTLNGASVSVTVNGTTSKCGIYYATATQIAAVLPSGTPVGVGTVTVSYNNTVSSPASIVVVAAAPGLGTFNGLAIATNTATGALYTYTNAIKPGEIIVLWGSGLGAVPADSDTVFTNSPHATSVPLQIFIGGIQANVLYAGDSGYPGVNQIDVTVPASVLPGCNVSLVIVSGSANNLITSNTTAIPVAANGGACSDPLFSTDGTTTTTLSGQTTVKTGSVFVFHVVSPGSTAGSTQTNDFVQASFAKVTGASTAGNGTRASIGSCSVVQTAAGATSTANIGLDGGVITVAGPAGNATLTNIGGGSSVAQLAPGFIPASGGAFTFKGPGGADVGSFTATLNFPNPPLIWINQATSTTVTRSSGLLVTWSGGAGNSYVEIFGSSTSASGAKATYFCFAPTSAGQFTVPTSILMSLPAGTGNTTVANTTGYSSFTATGLDTGFAFGLSETQGNSIYN